MAQFSDQLLTSCDGRPSSGKILGSSMSVGLVAKKFWNKLVHVQQTTQQLQIEVRINLIMRMVKGIFVTRDRPFLIPVKCEMALFFLVNRDFHSRREP